jgi:hypothetical protein
MTSPQDPFAQSGPSSSTPGYGAPSYGTPGPGGHGYGSAGYGPAPAPYGAQESRTETKAIAAIVLAVLAWTPTVPFLGAIAALVLAHMARRDIDASGGRLTGRSLCTWATVLSWIHLAFVAVLLVLVLLVFVLGIGFSL